MKKKLLVLAYEYYPTENANTRIIHNTCEILADQFDIDLVTPEVAVDHPDQVPVIHFRVIRVPSYSFHKEKCTAAPSPATYARMLSEKFLGKLDHDDTRMLERLYEREVRKAVNLKDYDAVVSFSAPILAHGCASRMVRGTDVPWIPVCLDPYFSHRIFGPEGLEERKKREEKYMEPAAKVLVAYPTDRDYLRAKVAFSDKIVSVEMPGVDAGAQAPAGLDHGDAGAGGTCVDRPVSPIHCAFFGSMYREIRDPRPAIALFNEVAKDPEIEVRFAGHLEDLSEEELFPKSGKIQYLGKLTGDDLAKNYAETDVLINIGNSVDNQMPSKIFEYISTGKPIINIYKSQECPTLKYLTRYPLALNLSEEDLKTDLLNKAAEVRTFIKTNSARRVPAEEIRKTFEANTFESFAASIASAIKSPTKEDMHS